MILFEKILPDGFGSVASLVFLLFEAKRIAKKRFKPPDLLLSVGYSDY
ncbi:hypothetical protein [Xanthomonas campestris]|nr:hypothetical protein [Xanthomonas campestris]